MQHKKIIFLAIFAVSFLGFSFPASAEPIVINSKSVDLYDDIPPQYLSAAKQMWFNLPGLSHSRAYYYGLLALQSQNANYKVNLSTSPGTGNIAGDGLAINYNSIFGAIHNGTRWEAGAGEEDWFYGGVTKPDDHIDYINLNKDNYRTSVFGLSWCWDPGVTLAQWGEYIEATQSYSDHAKSHGSKVYVVFTTGPVEGGTGESRAAKYALVRNYFKDNIDHPNEILFDYADILKCNNAGDCSTTEDIHSENEKIENLQSHIGSNGELRLAKAAWVLMARVAGWNPGGATCTTNSQCDDGLYCNGVETCSNGNCTAGSAPCASDGYECTTDCNEAQNSCQKSYNNLICDDSNSCTQDSCSGTGSDGCAHTANDAATCSISGECSANARCSAGTCVADKNISLCANALGCEQVTCTDAYQCSYASCPIGDDLSLWLKLDDGTAQDSSLNAYPVTAVNSEKIADRFNNPNGAMYLDGQDYLDAGTPMFGLTNQLSMALWINPASLGVGIKTLIERNQYVNPFMIKIDSTNKLKAGLRVANGTGVQYLNGPTISTNKWSHVVYTYDGLTSKLYLDGSLAGTLITPGGNIPSSTNSTYLGRSGNGGEYFNGSLDDVRIYKRALTEAEITALYTQANASCTQGDGDIDCDKDVDISDIQIAVNVFLGIETDENKRTRANVDTSNPDITIADIQKVVNIFLNID